MDNSPRRVFLRGLAGVAAASPAFAQAPSHSAGEPPLLPRYARAQNYKSLKQSSFDRSGGNHDYWEVKAGESRTVFEANGFPSIISRTCRFDVSLSPKFAMRTANGTG